jgi:L-malate glycosyltransferase
MHTSRNDGQQFAGKRVIVQVTYSLVAGGAERYALDLATTIDPRRFESRVYALDKGGPLEAEIREGNVPFAIMGRRPGIDFRLMWRLYREFRRNKASIVQTHHFSQLFYSLAGARLAGASVIHTEHGLSTYTKPHLRRALRFLSRFCAAVVVVGSEGVRLMEKDLKIHSKVHLIPGGVKLDKFASARADARSALGIAESDRILTTVARLHPEKNHRMLVQAFAIVKQTLRNVQLLIVGEGPERAAIEQEIATLRLEASVRLLGVRRDIPVILNASDLFLLSSDREGLPIAILEAMAAGLPVVATSVGDVPSVVSARRNGLLVPSGNVEEFAKAITEVLSNPQLSRVMGQESRDRAQEFSLDRMVERFENLYETHGS